MLQKAKSFLAEAKSANQCAEPSGKSDSATRFCKVCFSEITGPSWLRLFGDSVPLCGKCFQKFEPNFVKWMVGGFAARALYSYNENLKSVLFQYKGCYDIELADVFIAYQAFWLRYFYRDYLVVPAPSFAEKDIVRGFNHVELMFRPLGLPTLHPILKTQDIKQADRNFSERQDIGRFLRWDPRISVEGKKILFVDDLLTTGATAKACCGLLRSHGASRVQILVMGFTPMKTQKAPRGIEGGFQKGFP